MTTLLLSALLFFAYCAFTHAPASVTCEEAPLEEAASTVEPIIYPNAWLSIETGLVRPCIGWSHLENTLTITQVAIEVAADISALGIRELKKLASAAKIKNYSNMRKANLIKALLEHA